MVSLSRSSRKLFQNVSPIIEVSSLKSSLLGIRHASLTSAIGHAARKSAAVETSRESRYTRRSRDNDKYSPVSRAGVGPPAPKERSVAFSKNQSKGTDPQSRYAARKSATFETSRETRYTHRSRDNNKYSPPSRAEVGHERSGAFSESDSKRTDRRVKPSNPRSGTLSHWEISSRSGGRTGKGAGNIPRKRGKDHRPTDEEPERVKQSVHVPISIPYTTPASEFIYGTSAVEAALRCTRRKLYVLYMYQSADEKLSPQRIAMRKLALARGIKVKMAFANWESMLDKMSGGRPHNGCILEASPLPQLPVSCLEPVSLPTDAHFNVSLSAQSAEEAAVNGSSNRVERVPRYEEGEQPRFPFVLLLDGILDPGNMGAIIRSAYYLGVDALVLVGRNCAPMTPVTIKASAGAAENMTILKVSNDMDFIRRSRQNGWRFYAADSPDNVADMANSHEDNSGVAGSAGLLTSAPTVLMLGSEATGLLPRIKAQADGFISIPGARIRPYLGINDAARVDSLNVSVAAALLIEMLMHIPLQIATVPPPTPTEKASIESPPKSFEFN